MQSEGPEGDFQKVGRFPPLAEAASKRAIPLWLLLAQTSQEMVDAMLLQEMERLENGGKHPEPLSDFLTFV